MGSRRETEKSKLIQEKCQNLLSQMLRDEDNKYCVDCDAKGPRWASWNLGVFLCIRCAGIHRNLGVHISRVKSVNLDSWTPEQVVSLQQMGNSRARAVYEAQLPDGFRRPQTDSALESFIRAKYEHKKYLAREWVAPPPPKVDWDKEIDEEIEKQKRKKKAASLSSAISAHNSTGDNKISIKAVPIPAPLPKPKGQSASPKSGSRLPPPSETNGTSNLDLLGLSSPVEAKEPPKSDFSGGDIFSGFLSGPPPVSETTAAPQKNQTTTSTISAVDALAKEEEDFFKQSVPNAAEKAKLTNDSILALYATQPTTWITNNFRPGQFVPQSNASMMPQSNAGMMPVMHPQMQPQHNFLMNGFGPQVGINQQQQHSAISGTMGGPLIPGANMTPAIPNASQQQPMFANFGMPNTAGGNQMSLFGEPSQSQTAQTNPTGNLNQQIGNLNLGNVWH